MRVQTQPLKHMSIACLDIESNLLISLTENVFPPTKRKMGMKMERQMANCDEFFSSWKEL